MDSKAQYLALSSTRSQEKKLKQRQCPFDTVQVKVVRQIALCYQNKKNARQTPSSLYSTAVCKT